MRSVALDEYASGVANAAGVCQVSLGPIARQTWNVTNLAVSSDSATSTEARVYVGAVSPQGYQAGTYDGGSDNTAMGARLTPGAVLTVVWSGATPGASCTMSVYGTMEVPH